MTAPSFAHVLRSLPADPKCPRCGRGYAAKGLKAGESRPTFYCDPERPIGGCGEVWR